MEILILLGRHGNPLSRSGFGVSQTDKGARLVLPLESFDRSLFEEVTQLISQHASEVSQKQSQQAPAQLPQSSFDPTKPLVISSLQLPGVTEKQEKRVEELMKKKETMESRVPERCICVFHATGINPRNFGERTYQNMMQQEDGLSVESGLEEEVEEKTDMAIVKEVTARKQKRMEENQKFRTKAKRDLELLESQRVYKRTTIRVHLPDRTIIQAYFAPRETIKDVMDVVRTALRREYRSLPFYLFNAPPKVVLRSDSQLRYLRMVPAAMVYLGWEASGPDVAFPDYILPEMINDSPVADQIDRGALLVEEGDEAESKKKKKSIPKLLRNLRFWSVCRKENQDNLSEWLRRQTRNLLGFARAGSNPAVVAFLYRVTDSPMLLIPITLLIQLLHPSTQPTFHDSLSCIRTITYEFITINTSFQVVHTSNGSRSYNAH